MDKLWLIYSADENWAIGNKGDLLVRIPEDMKDRFKAMTLNTTVVMGKNTLLSFPGQKGLPKRNNVVLTRSTELAPENVTVLHSLDEVFSYLETVKGNVFVIGGGKLYNSMRPYANGAFVTKIYKAFDEADTFVEDLDKLPEWEIIYQGKRMTSVAGVDFSYVDYVNNNPQKYGENR